jgi:sterol desaturase/sphingolipid hydroxylase (fatty acid hydroxylase superfamily)
MPDLMIQTPAGTVPLIAAFAVILGGVMFRSAVIVGAAFLWLRFSAFARGRRVFRIALPDGQIRSELIAAIPVLMLDAVAVTALVYASLLTPVPATWGNTIVTFMLMFVLFEIWFYVTHRAMHTRALFFIHRQHHVAQVTDPMTSLSFSLLERLVLLTGALGAAIMLSWTIGISVAGLAAYGLANYALNVLGHSNVEVFPGWFARSRLGRWLVTPTYHALHHARYRGHYGLFTSVLDRMFGSVYPDYELLQDRASVGEGLTRQGERLKAETQGSSQKPGTIRPKVEIRTR